MSQVTPAAPGWHVVTLDGRDVVSFVEVLAFRIYDDDRIAPVTFSPVSKPFVLMDPEGQIEYDGKQLPCLDAYRLFRYGIHDRFQWADRDRYFAATAACDEWEVPGSFPETKLRLHNLLVSQGRI